MEAGSRLDGGVLGGGLAKRSWPSGRKKEAWNSGLPPPKNASPSGTMLWCRSE